MNFVSSGEEEGQRCWEADEGLQGWTTRSLVKLTPMLPSILMVWQSQRCLRPQQSSQRQLEGQVHLLLITVGCD